jgi:hypothetical protein
MIVKVESYMDYVNEIANAYGKQVEWCRDGKTREIWGKIRGGFRVDDFRFRIEERNIDNPVVKAAETWARYRVHVELNSGAKPASVPAKAEMTRVIFNNPATIVFWSDGTKTVVKAQGTDKFDPEKGLAMAICKRAFGNKGNYYNKFRKYLPKEEKETVVLVTDRAREKIEQAFQEYENFLKKQIRQSRISQEEWEEFWA